MMVLEMVRVNARDEGKRMGLKKCPFCGVQGALMGGPMFYDFGCNNDECKVRPRGSSEEAWNKRAKP